MTPSIRNKPLFKPKTDRNIYMEDINSMTLAIFEKMREDLKVEINKEDEDRFFESVCLFLEESFNYPEYRNYN